MRNNCLANYMYCVSLVAGIVFLTSGCAATNSETVKAPIYSTVTSQQAVYNGAQAITDFRREYFLAPPDKRTAEFSQAREKLAGALAALRPSPQAPVSPEYEQQALCLETALAAMDRIIESENRNDAQATDIGWRMLDQSSAALLLSLKGQKPESGSE